MVSENIDKRRKAAIISLGCSKNLVDSERLMAMLENVGITVRHEPKRLNKNDIVIINTCGFIQDAKEESIDTILKYAEARNTGRISGLYVMGCLSERYSTDLPAEIPEVDAWYGKTDWARLVSDLAHKYPATAPYDRIISTPRHHAYIKIAEGCDRFCAFCAIPLITGRYKSRSIEEIEQEITMLTRRGVKEFNIIAQDLSAYGKDLPGNKPRLAELIDRISDIEGVEWVRLHYAYPSDFPYEVLDVMARKKNVCNYLDIALQHISDNVLSNMRRHITGSETRELLKEIRRKVPGIHIRTTLMTGFPGEGEKEFEELLEFVREQRFERMGAFAYSEEDDTYAARNLKDEISEEIKQERLNTLMALQEKISEEIQNEKVGTTIRVIIDREDPDYYIGRTEWDSPEIDPEVLIEKSVKMKRGEFYDVTVTSSSPFELFAVPATDNNQ